MRQRANRDRRASASGMVRGMFRPRSVTLAVALAALTAASGLSAVAPAAKRPSGATRFALPWIDDDYTKAVAEARARRVPLFIEAWAPW